MRVPYQPELENIRAFMETQGPHPRTGLKFPTRWCIVTSQVVKQVLGLEMLCGAYDDEVQLHAHTWNYDRQRRLYIDLTMDQFRPCEKIIMMHQGRGILYPGECKSSHEESSMFAEQLAQEYLRTKAAFQEAAKISIR